MRNLFGYGATAIAASAVSFFAAAGFADQHPESFLGQCFQKARKLCAADRESACCATATSDTPMPSRPNACPETSTLAIQFEPLPPASTQNRFPGTIVIQEEEETRPTGIVSSPEPEQCELPEQVRVLMKGLANLPESKDLDTPVAAPFMPYCEDEESTPAVMPYAEGTHLELNKALKVPTPMEFPIIKLSSKEEVLEYWLGFFREPTVVPECKEDPAMHQQYPGVPVAAPPKSRKAAPIPFEEELQEFSPLPKLVPDATQLLKPDRNSKKRSNVDTTECRPSDFGFDNLGLRPF